MDFAPISQNHSVDEAMVPYYGHHGAKQLLRGKPIRYGYKLWAGTTPKGYICWYEPYQGSKTTMEDCYKQMCLGVSIVLEYADRLQNTFDLPYCFYFDNFFTSLFLIDELTKRNIGAVETIRKNRIVSSDLRSDKELQTERGSWDFKVTNDKSKVVIKWAVLPCCNVSRYSRQEKKGLTFCNHKPFTNTINTWEELIEVNKILACIEPLLEEKNGISS
nr:unnamed protein product [Callosobruchus chinensis]